ncbi:MAG: proline dehydrogenase [Flavobacteriales bacterium]|nr:proline dehydrogenase [Flavobacteriales bacterium]
MLSFENTEIAFKSKSTPDLKRAYWLFKIVSSPIIVKIGKVATNFALSLRLPIRKIVKATIFKQFCGGESIEDCRNKMEELATFKVGTILDYSIEGKTTDEDFEHTVEIIIQTIQEGRNNKNIPFAVFKVTGIGSINLLEKASDQNYILNESQILELEGIKNRIERICAAAHTSMIPVFIDAEESWIQAIIDTWALEMMLKYNLEKAIVYNTLQMYRHDRLEFLTSCSENAKKHGIKYGIKLVRGAYMEKERERAQKLGYPSPIYPDKNASDDAYNTALKFILEHEMLFALCAGTHNEESSLLLTQELERKQISRDNDKFYFAQLLGMSDHISFNLSNAGFKVAKYVPFGPVKEVMPYLLRRADENTSVAGQTGRELSLIIKELDRRKKN